MLLDRTTRQNQAIDKWVKAGCKATIVGTTGVGKTRIGIMSIQRFLQKNSDKQVAVIVPSVDLQRQWENGLKEWNLSQVPVYILNSAARYPPKAHMYVIDEIHRANSESFRALLQAKQYGIILGLTATYERLDNLHKQVMDYYCPVVDNITYEEAVINKWVSQVKCYQVLIEPDDFDIYQEHDKNFISAFSFFNFDFKLAMSVVADYKFRIKYISDMTKGLSGDKKKIKSSQIMTNAMKFQRSMHARKSYVHNHPEKTRLCMEILKARPDCKAITFWKTIKMASKVKLGYVLHSKQTKQKRAMTMEQFALEKTGVINSSKALDEGINVPGLNLAIVGGFDSSKLTAVQRRGRIARYEEGKVSEMFFLVIKNTIEEKWFQNAWKDDYEILDESQLMSMLTGDTYLSIKASNKEVKDSQFRY